MGDHNTRNRASRERISVVIARLGNKDVAMAGGWSSAALLAHIAFWERLAAARLEKWLRDGEPPATAAPELTDLTNAAGMRQWHDTPPAVAAAQALDAASATDRLVEGIDAERFAVLKAFNRHFLYDRSMHRTEHLTEIERALQ